MTEFEKINSTPVLEVLDKLWIKYVRDWNWYCLYDNWKKDTSFQIDIKKNIITDFWKTWIKWSLFDFIWQYCIWITESDMRTDEWRKATLEYCAEKWLIQLENKKKEFIKSLTAQDLLERFEEFKLNWFKVEVQNFLINRWVSYDFIQKNIHTIWNIFKDIWYYDNYFTTEFETYKDEDWKWITKPWDTPKTTWVLLFPCYNAEKQFVWMKMRRVDNKTIRGKKSLAVWKTWLLYEWDISTNRVIIVEWEIDYIILRLLWFKKWEVIWNLWWVQSHRQAIKSLVYNTSEVICLYDNDEAWENGKKELQKTIWFPIFSIEFPIREDIYWKRITDVNDLFKIGFDTKQKWDKLLKDLKPVDVAWKEENWVKEELIFIRKYMEFYDVNYRKPQDKSDLAAWNNISTKELFQRVRRWLIPQYDDYCYSWGDKPNCYNLLNKESVLFNPWDVAPILDDNIKYLIENIWWWKKLNIEWLHKAILYKLTHIDDVTIPALVLYWYGWSGKWTWIKLLELIFWEENTLIWLWQKDLESNYDTFQWHKIIVEFKEVSSWNKFEDKKVLDRLKWIIWESRITINPKYWKTKEVDNIAWFQMSSNHSIPIQLDSKHSWNRRFTIMKVKNQKLKKWVAEELWGRIFKEKTKKTIREYIAWLYDNFPEVVRMHSLPALDNIEKRNLETNIESGWNLFFEWLEDKFPHIQRITNQEMKMLLPVYWKDTWDDIYDARFKQRNFDNNLSHRYEKWNVFIRGKNQRGYRILKTESDLEKIPKDATPYFAPWQVERIEWILF